MWGVSFKNDDRIKGYILGGGNMGLSIRKIDETFLDELVSFKKRMWEENFKGIYSDEYIDSFDKSQHKERFMYLLKQPNVDLLAAYFNQEMVGYFSYGTSLNSFSGYEYEIHLLYILRSYQNLGIGQSILNYCTRKLFFQGARNVLVSCNKYNQQAQAFYHRMGGLIVHIDDDQEDTSVPQVKFAFKLSQGKET